MSWSSGVWIGCVVMLTLVLNVGIPERSASSPKRVVSTSRNDAPKIPKIDLNRASLAELQALPGIGPAKAKAILAYRKRKPFKKTTDLIRVHGIGRKTYRRIRALVHVDKSTP